MEKLPEFLKKYFWDVEFKKINLKKNSVYVLRRILEYGDGDAVVWMRKNFKESEIRNVLSKFRGYSRKSANFWALILDVPRGEVLCMRERSSKRSLKAPEKIWPY